MNWLVQFFDARLVAFILGFQRRVDIGIPGRQTVVLEKDFYDRAISALRDHKNAMRLLSGRRIEQSGVLAVLQKQLGCARFAL